MPTNKVISSAISRSIHTPSVSPCLLVTAVEIATSALGAAEAGAAKVAVTAASMDGHVRVGLEDPLWLGRGELWSFGELDQHSAGLATWLRGRGVAADDLVAVALPNDKFRKPRTAAKENS